MYKKMLQASLHFVGTMTLMPLLFSVLYKLL